MGTEKSELNGSEIRLITAVIYYFLKYNRIPTTFDLEKLIGIRRQIISRTMQELADKGFIHRPPRSSGGPPGGKIKREGGFRLTDAGELAYHRNTNGYYAEAVRLGFIRPADDQGDD
jgi:DNA-binding MarR family transcriptional regulator